MTEVSQTKAKTTTKTTAKLTRRPVRPDRIRGTTNVHKIMGNKLRQLRINLGMSQQELGEKLNVSFQQIQKYEKGVNRIDAGRLIQIAHALDCGVDEFYDGLTERRIKTGVTENDIYIASREGRQLVTAMLAIERTDIRRRFIRLIEAIGGVETPADEAE